MINEFAVHIKKINQANFKGMHIDEALDYAYKQILNEIQKEATQGSTSCTIDLRADSYEQVCQFIHEKTNYTATLPSYSQWKKFLKQYIDARLHHDNNFVPSEKESVNQIHYEFAEDISTTLIIFDWSNMF